MSTPAAPMPIGEPVNPQDEELYASYVTSLTTMITDEVQMGPLYLMSPPHRRPHHILLPPDQADQSGA